MLVIAGPFRYGYSAVGLFIVLSGFCLMLPVVNGKAALKGGALQFFKRRARRILPPFYCAVGLSLLLIWLVIGHKTGTLWDGALPVSPKSILSCLLMLQDVWFRGKINTVLWSIAVEWRIYFFFPLLVLAYKRFGVVKTTAAAVVLSCVSWPLLRAGSVPDLHVQYFALFVLGALGAKIAYSQDPPYTRWRADVAWELIAAIGACLFMALSCLWRRQETAGHTFLLDMNVGVAASSLLVAASRGEGGWLRRSLGWRPLAFVGTFSYSIYLIHVPLLQVIWQYFVFPLHESSSGNIYAAWVCRNGADRWSIVFVFPGL